MLVISDASVLIAFRQIGHLWLLPRVFGTSITITPAVRGEIEAKGLMAARDFPWLTTETSLGKRPSLLSSTKLHAGEIEVLTLAANRPGALVLMDERRGRLAAKHLQVEVIGTGGILILAKRKDLIAAVAPILDVLIAKHGFAISPEVRREIVRQAGEA